MSTDVGCSSGVPGMLMRPFFGGLGLIDCTELHQSVSEKALAAQQACRQSYREHSGVVIGTQVPAVCMPGRVASEGARP